MKRRDFIRIAGAGTVTGIFLNRVPAYAAIRKYSELQYHRISDIRFITVRLDFHRPVIADPVSGTIQTWLEEPVHILYTDKGASGWGLTRGSKKQVTEIFELIKGKPVSDLIAPEKGVLIPDLSVFDFSLFDIAGKIAGKPVYRLIGKRRPEKTKCSSTFLISAGNTNNLINDIRADYDLGYRQFKLVATPDMAQQEKNPEQPGSVTRLVAENFPDCDIILNGNNAFTVDEFLQYMEGIRGTDICCIESPFNETIENYVKLYSWLRVHNMNPLLADGSIKPDETVLRQLGAQNIIDVFNHDILRTGYTGWINLAGETGSMGLRASPYTGFSCLRSVYAAHLAANFSNIDTIDYTPCASEDIEFPDIKIRKGKLILSSEPGFGMDLKIRP